MIRAVIVVLAGLGSVTAATANGYFQVQDPKDGSTSSSQVDLSGYELIADHRVDAINFVGRPDPDIMSVPAGYSDGIPLEMALKALLPPGWSGYLKPQIDKSNVVRWSRGITWTAAIEQIARQTTTSATVDWVRKIVTIDNLPPESNLAAQSPGMVPLAPDAAFNGTHNGSGPPIVEINGPILPTSPYEGNGQDLKYGAGAVVGDRSTVNSSKVRYQDYATLNDFLNEQIEVDIRGATLAEALAKMLPAGWEIDVRVHDSATDNVRVEMTSINARGAILDELMNRLHLSLYPYVNLRKAVVAAGAPQ